MRPDQLAARPIAEEQSESKQTGGTGEDSMLDDLLKDDDEDDQLGMIPEGAAEESPMPKEELESPLVIKAKGPMILSQ